MGTTDKLGSFILRLVNRMGRERDAVYLDTNAWSTLAKRPGSHAPLKTWLQHSGYHLWIARFQVAELARDSRVARGLAEILRDLPVVMLDREQYEFQGAPWHKVPVSLDEFIYLDSDENFNEFVHQMTAGPILAAAQQLHRDAANFEAWLKNALAAIPPSVPRAWSEFPARLQNWVRAKCAQNDVPVLESALHDPACYIGLKLSFGVLFVRYFVGRKRWKQSDYVDYLHAADMAYSRIVVTESNLAECLRQLALRPELTVPRTIATLKWLEAPFS